MIYTRSIYILSKKVNSFLFPNNLINALSCERKGGIYESNVY